MLQMRNQDHVRMNMLSSDIIPTDSHDKWFNAMLEADDKAFFILSHNNKPAGIIGFYDMVESCANWTFYLAGQHPPKGLGTAMCSLGLNTIFKKTDIYKIRTKVLDSNIKSLKLHERLGFQETTRNENAIELELDKNIYEKNSLK